jgi:hypothetical protein
LALGLERTDEATIAATTATAPTAIRDFWRVVIP